MWGNLLESAVPDSRGWCRSVSFPSLCILAGPLRFCQMVSRGTIHPLYHYRCFRDFDCFCQLLCCLVVGFHGNHGRGLRLRRAWTHKHFVASNYNLLLSYEYSYFIYRSYYETRTPSPCIIVTALLLLLLFCFIFCTIMLYALSFFL